MAKHAMPESMRFTKTEQQKLHTACIKLNKVLIAAEQKPIQESELAHLLIEMGLETIHVTKSGKVSL